MPPLAVTVRLLRAALLPTLEPKVAAPLPALTTRLKAPLTVLLKATLLLLVASVLPAARVIAPV